MTGVVLLSEYSHSEKKCVLTSTGQFRAADQSELGSSGFATRVRIGLWKTQEVASALFEEGGAAWFQLGGMRYCLSDGSIRISRTFVAPYVRKFRLIRTDTGERVVDFAYWYQARNDEFPDDGDFLHYVERSMSNGKRIAEFLCHWEVRKARSGDPTEADIKLMEKCVQRRLAN